MPARSHNKGYVLPLALVMVVVMSLVLTGLEAILAAYRNSVEFSSNQLALQQHYDDDLNKLYHFFNTRITNSSGYSLNNDLSDSKGNRANSLMVDGSLYQFGEEASTQFQIFDLGSLISLANGNRTVQLSLLDSLSADAATHQKLLDRYLDYTDTDSLTRLSGAEMSVYENQQQPHPLNEPLTSLLQLYSVDLWDEFLQAHPELLPLLSLNYGGLNINASPAAVLSAQGVPRDFLKSWIDNRPYQNMTELESSLGRRLPLDPMGIGSKTSKGLRIIQSSPDGTAGRLLELSLSPVRRFGEPWLRETFLQLSSLQVQPFQQLSPLDEATILQIYEN